MSARTTSAFDGSGIADLFNGHIDEFRISYVQRSDGWSGDISPSADRRPVYRSIHSAVDITTAYELLGAD